jgi:hypothetical protein
VDKWLKQQQSQILKEHYLILYSDDESMLGLLKSMDRLANEGDLFRCFCGPPDSTSTELLTKLKWYDATVEPYCYSTNVQEGKDNNSNANANANAKSKKYNEILWKSN